MNTELKGKVVVITGAASGIGRETALAFGRSHAHVVVSDASPAGEITAGLIRSEGGDALFVRCDVSDEDDVRRMMSGVVHRYRRIDCAFNNAGIEGTQAAMADY